MIELIPWIELEVAEGFLAQPLHRALHGTEVGLPHPQRPWQQKQIGMSGPRVGTATASRHLVPPGLDTGSMNAGVSRERAQRRSGGRRAGLGEHAEELCLDSGQRSGLR